VRVLTLHNFYRSDSPSGENGVYEAETALLRAHGHEVRGLNRQSDEIRDQGVFGLFKGGVVTPWNPVMFRLVRRAAEEFRPDIVHVHNTFPLISPAVFHAIGEGTARVATLHNYRLFCAAATPMRDGGICTECLDGRTSWPAFEHGCYRESRVASAPLAFSIALHRRIGTWTEKVDAFIALTRFQRERMSDAGLPRDRVWVKPNFYPGRPEVLPWPEREDRVVYVGRISPDKGVDDIVDAWLAWGEAAPQLVIVGDGPLRVELETRVRTAGSEKIRFVGKVAPEDARQWIGASRLLVLASRWFEGLPLVLCEAFAAGTPAAVSDLGALPQLVALPAAGEVFRAGDPRHLREVVSDLWSDRERLAAMAVRARGEFESQYCEERNYEQLMEIYDKALCLRRASRN
jgi:glycosyltransferase involved in cell wall biosynthesis